MSALPVPWRAARNMRNVCDFVALRESGNGTFETWRLHQAMSAFKGNSEVSGAVKVTRLTLAV